jgi:uncharacterized coiled-coil protein SlyX
MDVLRDPWIMRTRYAVLEVARTVAGLPGPTVAPCPRGASSQLTSMSTTQPEDTDLQYAVQLQIARARRNLERLKELELRIADVEDQVAAINDQLASMRGEPKYRDRASHARQQAEKARNFAEQAGWTVGEQPSQDV